MKTRFLMCIAQLMSVLVVASTSANAQSAPTIKPQGKDIPTIAKAASGSIVSIVMSDKDGKPIAQGTGFIVSKDGLVVTNYHVIAEGNSAVVKLPDGAFYAVDGVLAFDKVRDVAIIKAHGQNFRILALGNSDRVQVGEEVVAIGNPLSLESTVSNGIVSGIRAVKEDSDKYLQITAPISPGSSGGPLFNTAGEVIGITTLHLKGGENLNFAIPINDAKRLLRTNSSRLQNLPDELDTAHTGESPSTEGEGPRATSIARRYYQQLFDAGAFSSGGKATCGRRQLWTMFASAMSQIQTHFSLLLRMAMIKNTQRYIKWFKLVTDSSSDFQEVEKYYRRMQTIERTADYPYLHFFSADEFNEYTSAAQKVWRDGIRSLMAHVYEKGVKVASRMYHAGYKFDFKTVFEDAWWDSHELSKLSIEPSKMRYVRTDYRGGEADWRIETSQAGHCEKVARRSNVAPCTSPSGP